ncbi:MAG: hypothetical protein LBO71_10210, partial [Prevotellaceae bacterium]|nr:hypothetical protein [Prevotellaceae bacterium]
MRSQIMLTLLLMLGGSVALWAAMPYPNTITLSQINGAEKERTRLAQGHKKFDRQPTGFYVEQGKKVVVTVEFLTPAADSAAPVLTIGTLGFDVGGRTNVDHTLKEGKNTITATNSGLIYLSYVTNKVREPEGKVRVVFEAAPESEHVRAPRYVYGVTTQAEFEGMLNAYQTP